MKRSSLLECKTGQGPECEKIVKLPYNVLLCIRRTHVFGPNIEEKNFHFNFLIHLFIYLYLFIFILSYHRVLFGIQISLLLSGVMLLMHKHK